VFRRNPTRNFAVWSIRRVVSGTSYVRKYYTVDHTPTRGFTDFRGRQKACNPKELFRRSLKGLHSSFPRRCRRSQVLLRQQKGVVWDGLTHLILAHTPYSKVAMISHPISISKGLFTSCCTRSAERCSGIIPFSGVPPSIGHPSNCSMLLATISAHRLRFGSRPPVSSDNQHIL